MRLLQYGCIKCCTLTDIKKDVSIVRCRGFPSVQMHWACCENHQYSLPLIKNKIGWSNTGQKFAQMSKRAYMIAKVENALIANTVIFTHERLLNLKWRWESSFLLNFYRYFVWKGWCWRKNWEAFGLKSLNFGVILRKSTGDTDMYGDGEDEENVTVFFHHLIPPPMSMRAS